MHTQISFQYPVILVGCKNPAEKHRVRGDVIRMHVSAVKHDSLILDIRLVSDARVRRTERADKHVRKHGAGAPVIR